MQELYIKLLYDNAYITKILIKYNIFYLLYNFLAKLIGSSVTSTPNFLKVFKSTSGKITDECNWHPFNLGNCFKAISDKGLVGA